MAVFGQYNKSGIGADFYRFDSILKSFIYEKSWKQNGNEAKRKLYADAGQASPGQDKAVAIIRTGSRYYLIGIASSQITLLAELSEEEVPKETAAPSAFGAESYENFKNVIKKYTDKHRKDV